jgi:hypothetical protein
MPVGICRYLAPLRTLPEAKYPKCPRFIRDNKILFKYIIMNKNNE